MKSHKAYVSHATEAVYCVMKNRIDVMYIRHKNKEKEFPSFLPMY